MANLMQITEITKKPILSDLYQICYNAHSLTSFSPEKRAQSYVNEYSTMLENDLRELGENTGNYKEKFIAKFSEWMHAKSRCISSMITGPANFPVRRAQKANNAERTHSDNFYNWRAKYFEAVNRVPTKSPEDEIEAAERKLEIITNYQIELKEINIEARKFKKATINELSQHLMQLDFNPHLVGLLDFRGGVYKIPSYVLTNNNAKIKSTKEKLLIMQTRIDRKNTWQDINFEGGRVTIEDDRVKIFHDQKPSQSIINEIKTSGYNWSPNWGCWCRKHTGNAIYSLKFFSFINPSKN